MRWGLEKFCGRLARKGFKAPGEVGLVKITRLIGYFGQGLGFRAIFDQLSQADGFGKLLGRTSDGLAKTFLEWIKADIERGCEVADANDAACFPNAAHGFMNEFIGRIFFQESEQEMFNDGNSTTGGFGFRESCFHFACRDT